MVKIIGCVNFFTFSFYYGINQWETYHREYLVISRDAKYVIALVFYVLYFSYSLLDCHADDYNPANINVSGGETSTWLLVYVPPVLREFTIIFTLDGMEIAVFRFVRERCCPVSGNSVVLLLVLTILVRRLEVMTNVYSVYIDNNVT